MWKGWRGSRCSVGNRASECVQVDAIMVHSGDIATVLPHLVLYKFRFASQRVNELEHQNALP